MAATFAGRRRNNTNPELGHQFDAIQASFINLELPYCEQEGFYKHVRQGWEPDISKQAIQSRAKSYTPAETSGQVTRRIRRSGAVEDLEEVEAAADASHSSMETGRVD